MSVPMQYMEEVALRWAKLLTEIAEDQGAPAFAWHMAEVGCTPDSVRMFAERWRKEGFVPRDFAGEIDFFASELEKVSGTRGESWV